MAAGLHNGSIVRSTITCQERTNCLSSAGRRACQDVSVLAGKAQVNGRAFHEEGGLVAQDTARHSALLKGLWVHEHQVGVCRAACKHPGERSCPLEQAAVSLATCIAPQQPTLNQV